MLSRSDRIWKEVILNIEAVIFDCDGTLVDSERVGNQVLVEYIAEFGIEMSLEEAVVRYRGAKMANTVIDLEGILGEKLPEEFVPEFRRRSAEAFRENLKPMPGVHEALSGLDFPLAVASSAPRAKIELALEVTGLRDFFGDLIFSAYEINVWKPEPDLFLQAAEALEAHPEKCAVIEDSDLGIQAGLAAGMQVYAYVEPEVKVLPEGVIRVENLQDLPDLILPGTG